jgi:hypothetical protein
LIEDVRGSEGLDDDDDDDDDEEAEEDDDDEEDDGVENERVSRFEGGGVCAVAGRAAGEDEGDVPLATGLPFRR